jgi:hypothetical protein
MQLHCFGADAQGCGNRMVGAALEDPLQHILLTGSQADRAGRRVFLCRPLDLGGRQQFGLSRRSPGMASTRPMTPPAEPNTLRFPEPICAECGAMISRVRFTLSP